MGGAQPEKAVTPFRSSLTTGCDTANLSDAGLHPRGVPLVLVRVGPKTTLSDGLLAAADVLPLLKSHGMLGDF